MGHEHAITLLWNQFVEKLEADWDQYDSFGENINEAKSQINFSAAVVAQMDDYFKEHNISFDTLNSHTLHNYFKTNRLPKKAKPKTLHSFSAFLGYKNWSEFCEKNETKLKSQKTGQTIVGEDKKVVVNQSTKPTTPLNKNANNIKKSFWSGNKVLLLGLFALITLLILAYNYFKVPIENQIEYTLLKSNAAEFNAYAQIPHSIDSNSLKKYFTTDGTAYNSIMGILIGSKIKRRKLLIPPSSHVIEEFEFESVKGETAIAYTTEHWIVRWYDSTAQREILYDTVNHHKYYLKKKGTSWKVHIDEYVGTARVPASELVK